MREAIEGKEYIVGKDGKLNIRCGGSYVRQNGKLFVIEPGDESIEKSPIDLNEEEENEIQE